MNKVTSKGDNIMKSAEKQYIASIEALFPIKGKAEKKYINDFRINVLDYCEENHVESIQALNEAFGTPQEVVNGYFSNIDTEYVLKKVRFSKWLKIILSSVLVVIILTGVVYCGVLVHEYISYLEEQVVMTDTEQSDTANSDTLSDLAVSSKDKGMIYSTLTEYITLKVAEGEYINEYRGEYPRPYSFIVLPDCRVVIHDRVGYQLLLCDLDGNIEKIELPAIMRKIWCEENIIYMYDTNEKVYYVNEYNFVDMIEGKEIPRNSYGELQEKMYDEEIHFSLDILKVEDDGTFYTEEITKDSEYVIQKYDSEGNKLEYAYIDKEDCVAYPMESIYIDNNSNIWIMLCKRDHIGIYLVTLGNADVSIAEKVDDMYEKYSDFYDTPAFDCTDGKTDVMEYTGYFDDAFTYDKTQIELRRGTRFTTTTKTLYYKNDYNEKILSLKVTVTFAYDGDTARCIGIAPDASTYAAGWTIEEYYTSNDVGRATVTAVFVHDGYLGEDKTYTSSLTIHCGPDGKIY